jgi:zinc D-Ala-D-Ala carboxypeptidase
MDIKLIVGGVIVYCLYKALPVNNSISPKLSNNFNLSEFEVTNTGLPNKAPKDKIPWLRALAIEILQPLRDKIGAIRINSGYRSPDVNVRIGGSPTSQHMQGQAADIISLTGKTPKEIFMELYNNKSLPISQAILYVPNEGNFIHVAIDPQRPAKRQFLIKQSGVFDIYTGGDIIL